MNSVQTKYTLFGDIVSLIAEFIIKENLLQVSKNANGFLRPKVKIAITSISSFIACIYNVSKS